MKLFRGRVIALAALSVAGCAFNSSPADGLQFKAPPDWRPSPGIMGFMQFWRPPADERQVLLLVKSPKTLQPSDVFSDARLNDTLKNATIEQRQTIQICGNQPATYVAARGTSSRGGDDRVDLMMTNISGTTYFAMYVRPLEAAANPMAEAALKELCSKP
ncbi:MAG: hypothetical protein WCC84_04470 [Candidatus Cybelea sp.]